MNLSPYHNFLNYVIKNQRKSWFVLTTQKSQQLQSYPVLTILLKQRLKIYKIKHFCNHLKNKNNQHHRNFQETQQKRVGPRRNALFVASSGPPVLPQPFIQLSPQRDSFFMRRMSSCFSLGPSRSPSFSFPTHSQRLIPSVRLLRLMLEPPLHLALLEQPQRSPPVWRRGLGGWQVLGLCVAQWLLTPRSGLLAVRISNSILICKLRSVTPGFQQAFAISANN